jgi:uncharacterized protein (TIGR00730 family)
MTSNSRPASKKVDAPLQPERKRTPPHNIADHGLLSWTEKDREDAAAFTHKDPWRVLRIQGEFVAGFDALAEVGPGISIFGSARTPENDPVYEQACRLGRMLAEAGVTVITGGGPGVMEATNRGAFEVDGESVGVGIELPFESGLNRYVSVGMEFRYFFVRKVMFVKYALGFVFFPGGFGTLDELFEVVTLIQTGRMDHVPVVLVGTDHWSGLTSWIDGVLLRDGRISEDDTSIYTVTDDIEETARIMIEAARFSGKIPDASPTSVPEPPE